MLNWTLLHELYYLSLRANPNHFCLDSCWVWIMASQFRTGFPTAVLCVFVLWVFSFFPHPPPFFFSLLFRLFSPPVSPLIRGRAFPLLLICPSLCPVFLSLRLCLLFSPLRPFPLFLSPVCPLRLSFSFPPYLCLLGISLNAAINSYFARHRLAPIKLSLSAFSESLGYLFRSCKNTPPLPPPSSLPGNLRLYFVCVHASLKAISLHWA